MLKLIDFIGLTKEPLAPFILMLAIMAVITIIKVIAEKTDKKK